MSAAGEGLADFARGNTEEKAEWIAEGKVEGVTEGKAEEEAEGKSSIAADARRKGTGGGGKQGEGGRGGRVREGDGEEEEEEEEGMGRQQLEELYRHLRQPRVILRKEASIAQWIAPGCLEPEPEPEPERDAPLLLSGVQVLQEAERSLGLKRFEPERFKTTQEALAQGGPALPLNASHCAAASPTLCVAEVLLQRGKWWGSTGVVRNQRLLCHVEETLFLMEKGSLLLLSPSGCPVPIQTLYHTLHSPSSAALSTPT
ncbi:hypothetical protein CLOM_g21722 [Closterium sp. NIES-68]|nr:hypothetical protein CLOM_g21722 [Closterium sp. NIES-68]